MVRCDAVTGLLSSGLLQRHLLPRLDLSDLLSFESIGAPFKHLVASASEKVWHAVSARTVPPNHHLLDVQTGFQQAARQYASTERAVKTGNFTFR